MKLSHRHPWQVLGVLVIGGVLAAAPLAHADAPTGDEAPIDVPPPYAGKLLEEPPQYGIYYDRYEPSFYTGFAPRTLDPRRIHLHIGRGNQLRATVVLSDRAVAEYARDLLFRYQTYRELIDSKRIVLTQNEAFGPFETKIKEIQLEQLVANEQSMSVADVRERNIALMSRLNPGRVFRIRMPAATVFRRWLAQVEPGDRTSMSKERQLALLNLMLPTRLWIAELDGGASQSLTALVRATPADGATPTPGELAALQTQFFALLAQVSGDMYPLRGDSLQFDEFTAIYPIGSFNEYTEYRGHKIPMYPTPGRRALTTHQRTKTVDHIPEKAIYSYFPWIPYMHVGTTLHNSYHTLWWRMDPKHTAFLPDTWKSHTNARTGKDYAFLWLLSRGPMSHGCTHVNGGHISELRQLLPAPTEDVYKVDSFLNKSYLYDVFDIDGDFQPEVMGVRYFIAYSLRNKKPNTLRVRNERHAYYDWLYGGELKYDATGAAYFEDIQDGHFIGRTATQGAHYDRAELYEAEYAPHLIQFYRMVDIPFARQLRQVSLHHPMPGLKVAGVAKN